MKEIAYSRAAVSTLARMPANLADRIRGRIRAYAEDPSSQARNVTIPRVEYDRLCAAEDEFIDLQTALAGRKRIEAGTEELVPAAVADRLIDGASPLKVWRSTAACPSPHWPAFRASTASRSRTSRPGAPPAPSGPCAHSPTRSASPWTTSSPPDGAKKSVPVSRPSYPCRALGAGVPRPP